MTRPIVEAVLPMVARWSRVDLTQIEPCSDTLIALPNGRLLHIEWLEGELGGFSCTGYQCEGHLVADETYRLSGYEPSLRDFHEVIPDATTRALTP